MLGVTRATVVPSALVTPPLVVVDWANISFGASADASQPNDTDIASVARPAFYRQGASGGCGVRLDLASVCTHAWHHADQQIWCCAVALPSRLPV